MEISTTPWALLCGRGADWCVQLGDRVADVAVVKDVLLIALDQQLGFLQWHCLTTPTLLLSRDQPNMYQSESISDSYIFHLYIEFNSKLNGF